MAPESRDIGVVVPALNEADRIARTLERLRAVLPAGTDLVVADGGSEDGTAAIAARLARVVEAPRGRGLQMNAGARAARGGILVFVHADCWLDPGALEEARDLLADPALVAVAFRQRVESSDPVFRWTERFANFRSRRLRSILGDSGLALRRETFERVGGFPEVPLFEDLGISARLRALRGRFVLTRARIHVDARRWKERGVLRQTLRNWSLILRYWLGADPARLARAYETSSSLERTAGRGKARSIGSHAVRDRPSRQE